MRAHIGVAAVALLALAGCGGTGGLAEEGSISQGKQLFLGEGQCASCHTLAHAGAKGTIGPNLDAAFVTLRREGFDDSTIREVVDKQILYPTTDPPTGEPGMPAKLVTGQAADDVASYVACVAGRTPPQWEEEGCGAPAGETTGGGTTTGGGGGNDPKSVFASAGCSGCHTLKAAGATGTVGPNLDQSTIDVGGAVRQIQHGGGVMPAFEDKLDADQIQALAEFIVQNRGK